MQRTLWFAAQGHLVIRINLPTIGAAKTFYRCPATALQHAIQCCHTTIADNQARGWNGAYQMVELNFYCGQIGKNISMIKLQVIEYRGARAVVYKLGAFLEKCSVVFVCLNDKKRRVGQPCGDGKILRYATDQKPRVQSGIFQYPCQHRTGSGFTMRARHSQHPFWSACSRFLRSFCCALGCVLSALVMCLVRYAPAL